MLCWLPVLLFFELIDLLITVWLMTLEITGAVYVFDDTAFACWTWWAPFYNVFSIGFLVFLLSWEWVFAVTHPGGFCRSRLESALCLLCPSRGGRAASIRSGRSWDEGPYLVWRMAVRRLLGPPARPSSNLEASLHPYGGTGLEKCFWLWHT